MCGICGFINKNQKSLQQPEMALTHMCDALQHRGPNSKGAWCDNEMGVNLGFRRLAIQDLSDSGNQPMISPSGRYALVMNGEIYNFKVLRSQLEQKAITFRSASDTEVLLNCVDQWGLEKALTKVHGMFALALYDRKKKQLSLARDRMGEKPLYYGWNNGRFYFASELKAMKANVDFKPEIEEQAVYIYLKYRYIKDPLSIYKGIYKLLPGHIFTLGLESGNEDTIPYWSLEKVALEGQRTPFNGTLTEATEMLEELMKQTVHKQMISDVPLGVFLSSGIDSASVAAIAQEVSASRIKTFTIGFNEARFNEAKDAKDIADYLGTEHTEWYVSPSDAQKIIPKLVSIYDEPFADPSQIPTHMVSLLAKQDVTVCLSGDGGDELFGGYDRFFSISAQWKKRNRVPAPLRRFPYHGTISKYINPFRVFSTLAATKEYDTLEAYYLDKCIQLGGFDTQYCSVNRQSMSYTDVACTQMSDYFRRLMYFDTVTFLKSNTLVKMDRASMACSLEVREPFLDQDIISFAWTLPTEFLVEANNRGKYVLRNLLAEYLPPSLNSPTKKGFHIPIGEWLDGGLLDYANELFSLEALGANPFINAEAVHSLWQNYKYGTSRNAWQFLWAMFVLQLWWQSNG